MAMRPKLLLSAFITCSGACFAPLASAQDAGEGETSSLGIDPALGLDPSAPQTGSLAGGMVPSYGQRSTDQGDWRFDFHGFLTAPLRIGINTRENLNPNQPGVDGQSDVVLHSPPMVPDDLETFSHTGVVPAPYVLLNFSYGNSVVTGNVSIVAHQPNVSAGFFDPTTQLGVNDLFVTILPKLARNVSAQVHVGAFSNRYGVMGEYDEGRYGTPLIARTNGVGEHMAATLRLGDVALLLEQGIQGTSNKAPAGIERAGWNGFADQRVGTSFVNHLHAGASYQGRVTVGAHYLRAWSQDDRAARLDPDGSIGILGADLRLALGRFGHFYFAAARTEAENARTVGRIVEVLNTRGGPGLMDNYLGWGSNGNGTLFTIGGQYDLSVGRLVSYPVPFYGDGPDILVSLFGMQTAVESDDKTVDPDPDHGGGRYDGVLKRKYGVEGSYSLLSWLALSARYDRVVPNVDNDRYSFSVLSPRVIFRTDWEASDQVVLQYSRWFNGSLTTIRTGYPPREDVRAIPDEHMLSLSVSMWW
jgi:hypothetical protein